MDYFSLAITWTNTQGFSDIPCCFEFYVEVVDKV